MADLYKNSYLAAVVAFIIVTILIYVFKVGYLYEIKDGQVTKRINWKIPVIWALLIWLLWYFVLYPVTTPQVFSSARFDQWI